MNIEMSARPQKKSPVLPSSCGFLGSLHHLFHRPISSVMWAQQECHLQPCVTVLADAMRQEKEKGAHRVERRNSVSVHKQQGCRRQYRKSLKTHKKQWN